MNKSEQKRFDELYRKHFRALKLQGMSDKTIEAYSRAVRRISAWFDCCPDGLEPLPDLTSRALRASWSIHRHPRLLFPNASGSIETVPWPA